MGAARLTGELLVAAPALADPSFARTVVLVLNHDDDGAFGVVLNRPVPVEVRAVLPTWHDVASAPATVFQGGPVGLDGALGVAVLPAAGRTVPAVNRVIGPFALVDLDAEPAQAAGISGLRIFAGHSGWSAGQLEAEVAAGDWFVLPALPADAVTPDPARLWRTVLRRQGGAMAIISTFGTDPGLN